ncbi:MAG: hypothetical protein KGJ72_15410, partial [Gammaproteobacteria bacterium]|nr:hypothetical protein [Gammaproteobacteria bacterium]
WSREGPPRWGEHWGHAWEQRRPGWDRWNRAAVPPRAPLPGFQRQYPRGRYPDVDRQRTLENRYYRYSPREPRDRSRLPAPQMGQRLAPQPGRPAPQQRRPEAPPQAHRTPPGAEQQRAIQQPGFNRPPARSGQPRPDVSRRPAAQPPRQREERDNSGRPPGQQQGDQRQPHGQRGNEHRQNQRPPG